MMLDEKKARENLYHNTSHAKEILDTMDLMKEVINQNAELHAEVYDLKIENDNFLKDVNLKG